MEFKKKKAFTLTELLVVVIVIGVLAAVVLPKFSKVVETRKTTEAEALMAAVRTEQEKRFTLDNHYVSELSAVKDILPDSNTKNFTYSLTSTGMEAASKGKYGYTLKMPSYADGRLCCESEAECAKLNKVYPLCSALTARADYNSGAECAGEPEEKQCSGASSRACGCKNGGTQTRVCDTGTGTWGAWSACTVPDECSCDGASTRACGCLGNGTQSRTCDTSTGTWSGWSACSISDACDCTSVSGPKPASESRDCNECGTQTSSYTCNASNGTWTETWSACSVSSSSECAPDCPEGKTWDGTACVCDSAAKAACVDKTQMLFIPSSDNKSMGQIKQATVHYKWNDDTCSCTCPSRSNLGVCGTVSSGMMVQSVPWDESTCNCGKVDIPKQSYYFKCVTRVVSEGGGMVSQGSYSTFEAAQSACLSGEDTNASFMKYLSGGEPVPGCRPYQDKNGMWVSCALTPAYYIKYQCSTEPPQPCSGYGFCEEMCMVMQPHD